MTKFYRHGTAEYSHSERKYSALFNRHVAARAFTVDYWQRYSGILFQGIPKSPFSEMNLIIGKPWYQLFQCPSEPVNMNRFVKMN